jgi:general secretion pathway protein I
MKIMQTISYLRCQIYKYKQFQNNQKNQNNQSWLQTNQSNPVNQSQHGFTLLEVLVALGIAATSLISLYTLANQLIKSAIALDSRQAALWCADNQMVLASLKPFAPSLGETSHDCSQMGEEFVIQQRVATTPNPLFRRIELAVFAKTAGTQTTTERLAFLTTVIPKNLSEQGERNE